MEEGSHISLTRQATLLGISRSSYYTIPLPVSKEYLETCTAVDELATKYPFYGARRLCVGLREDYGIEVGRDGMRSIMRKLSIEAIYPSPNTSIPNKEHHIYPYLLRNYVVTRVNEVWGTDITYIRLQNGFCYLTVIFDWYSRKVLSWRISNTMDVQFCVEALREALESATPEFHNSDQGSQFTSLTYLQPLLDRKVKVSMDGKGRCMDNILVERLWRTVKYENIFLQGYETPDEVRKGLREYFAFYNEKRYHQSLGYKTPDSVYYQKK